MDRPTAALEKMKDCLQHDSCGEWDCVYFANFKELQCVLAWVEELEERIGVVKEQPICGDCLCRVCARNKCTDNYNHACDKECEGCDGCTGVVDTPDDCINVGGFMPDEND